MDFSKIVSLVVGFIIIILIFVWINNQLNGNNIINNPVSLSITPTVALKNISPTNKPWYSIFLPKNLNSTVTPTPTPKTSVYNSKVTLSPTAFEYKSKKSISISKTPTEIPETGSPTLALALATSGLFLGYLFKLKK